MFFNYLTSIKINFKQPGCPDSHPDLLENETIPTCKGANNEYIYLNRDNEWTYANGELVAEDREKRQQSGHSKGISRKVTTIFQSKASRNVRRDGQQPEQEVSDKSPLVS